VQGQEEPAGRQGSAFPGDDADWPGLRAGGERMRLQAQVLDGRRPGAQHDTLGGGGNHQEHQQQPKELSEFWVGAEQSWAKLAGWLN